MYLIEAHNKCRSKIITCKALHGKHFRHATLPAIGQKRKCLGDCFTSCTAETIQLIAHPIWQIGGTIETLRLFLDIKESYVFWATIILFMM